MYSTCKTLSWWHINLRQNPLENKCTPKEHIIKKQSKLLKSHLNSSTGESCYTSTTQVWMMQPRLEQWGKPDEEIGFQVATLKSTICILYQKRYAFSNSWAWLLTPWGELLVSSGITCQVIKKPYREEFFNHLKWDKQDGTTSTWCKGKSIHPAKYTPN